MKYLHLVDVELLVRSTSAEVVECCHHLEKLAEVSLDIVHRMRQAPLLHY